MPYTIRDFRVNSLPGVPIPNSRYYVPNGNGTDLNEYITDLTGAYRLVGSAGSGTNVYGEEHTGLTGTTVTLSNSGTTGTLRIYKNGVRLDSTEFSYSGGTSVTVTDTLDSGDMIICDYKY